MSCVLSQRQTAFLKMRQLRDCLEVGLGGSCPVLPTFTSRVVTFCCSTNFQHAPYSAVEPLVAPAPNNR